MAFEITIPRLGWSMEEGTFVRWLKKDGDTVKAGEALFELEGEKAAQDIEAVDSGILRVPANAPQPGSVVAVGAVIGYLTADGETAPASVPASGSTKPALPVASSSTEKSSPPVPVAPRASHVEPIGSFEPAAAPSVRRLARERGLKLSSLAGSGPAGRIMAEDVTATTPKSTARTAADPSRIASPRARRVAQELGIDWRRLSGSGRDGRVREADIRQAALNPQGSVGGTSVAVSSRRRTIASRMLASSQQTAPVTITTRLDATNLVNLRQQFKLSAAGGTVPTFSDIIIKLVALALHQHPLLAARSEGDQWVLPASADDVHVGFAVDTEGGLVVPVVRKAGTMGLFELARQTVSLIEKARSSKLSNFEMQGGVFTITNLGSFGIDAFTPIINLPETAVLGIGRIRREAVVVDDQIVARDQLTLSLTFDHRIVDGAPAARFLQSVGQAIENPSAWLLRSSE